MTQASLTQASLTRSPLRLRADPSRVLARLFVPGQELLHETESRSSGVLSRILAMPEDTVVATLDLVAARFAGRHRDLPAILRAHYERVAHRVPDPKALSDARRLLIGAYFTNEYSVEAAALFNPSVVAHPDQSGLPGGAVRFVLSLRAVGEGHISSLEFRSGVVGPGRQLHIDEPGVFLESGRHSPAPYERDMLAAKLAEAGDDGESASFLLRRIPAHFDDVVLEEALAALVRQRVTRQGGARTTELVRLIAACSYDVDFDDATALAERVLWPHGPAESHGIEDARFVQFGEGTPDAGYYATYTAFDGQQVAPQLITTPDFQHFRISQLSGPAARNKGMALFPRKLGGQFVALSRWDRETNAIVTSPDGRSWDNPTTLQWPEQPWELIQLGNCGSPIETEAGWLVLTHGVGPMREYSMGALLLDLDDPSQVVGTLDEPFMRPEADERDGYVPNVVYSCGALAYGDQLLLPYGVSDSAVGFAFVDIPELLERLLDGSPATTAPATTSPAATRVNSSA